MHKLQILSSQSTSSEVPSPTTPQAGAALSALTFDACHLGVVLRAVLGVEMVLAVAALYASSGFMDWLLQIAWLTSGGLPATLVWLFMACSFKRVLHAMELPHQYVLGTALGMVAGLYASAMLHITVPVPAMQWLANALAGGVLSAVLIGYLILRARGTVPAATSAQLAVLQARIRPHFLFNALNSAVALVREEPHKAERLLEDLSDLFRAALQDPRSTIALHEEIELAQRYLDIEQVRFGARLQVQWDLDPDAMNVGLPPLLLQPLVENAVKHGVEPSEGGAKVTISVRRTSNQFILLRVTNTLNPRRHLGDKPPSSKGQGMALANVERRLRLLHDVRTEFSTAEKDGVFEVRICLPTS